MKKVLFIDNSPWWGGAEACLNTYTQDKSLKDFSSYICFPFPCEHQNQFVTNKKIYRYSKRNFLMAESYKKPIKGLDRFNKILKARRLKKILKEVKPDIVYFNLYRDRDIWDIKVAKEYGCKIVFHVRNLFHQANYDPDILDLSDLIIGTSKYVCNQIKDTGVKTKVVNVYDGINFKPLDYSRKNEIRAHFGLKANDIIGVFPAIIDPRKGQDSAIDAFKLVLKEYPDSKLIIVGGCNEIFNSYGKKISSMISGYEDSIIYLNHQKEVEKLYLIADYTLALSHDGEAYGLVPIESGICKLPIIATCVGATPELVLNEKTGYLVDPQDESALVSSLKKLHNNDTRLEMGEYAYEHINKNFSIKLSLLSINDELNKLL